MACKANTFPAFLKNSTANVCRNVCGLHLTLLIPAFLPHSLKLHSIPLRAMGGVSESPLSERKTGSSVFLSPVSERYDRIAFAVCLPKSTVRTFLPLPKTTAERASRSRSFLLRPQISLKRQPVSKRKRRMARLRRG